MLLNIVGLHRQKELFYNHVNVTINYFGKLLNNYNYPNLLGVLDDNVYNLVVLWGRVCNTNNNVCVLICLF